jgi:NAD(P)-dependent dehydrogenase (short-subunit alcohol dehydrogenase family)
MTPGGRGAARTVLVTGGAQGLGAAMVRHFTTAGHQVAIADIDMAAGQHLAGRTGCLFVPTDVGVFAQNQAAVREAVERFGGLDAVCLNVGIPGGTSIGDRFDPDRYRHSMQVNLDGVVYGMNAALPHLRSRGSGAILITSSLAGIAPATDLYYSAAKHALIGLTRSLALLLRQDHITVNALCPGFINTRVIAHLRDSLTTHGFAIADPDELAAAAATILDSPATGQAWEVQAGREAMSVRFPDVTLSRIADHRDRTQVADDLHLPEKRTL